MNLELAPYQKLGHDHLLNNDRAALFMGLGLGKTATTLSAIKSLMADGACRSALIVAPLRVANLTWPNELAKWDQFKNLRIESIRGKKPSGRSHFYTINYERLHEVHDLSMYDVVIFDELTRAKNPGSARIKSLRPRLESRIRRWGLTGTPRPNSLLELFAQIRLLDDGKRLGASFSQFRSTYFTPEDWNEYRWIPKPDSENKVYQKIHDLALTLRSSDYLDIPDTIAEDVEFKLPKEAHAIYAKLERELLVTLEGSGGERGERGDVVAINAAVLVNKLLQICGGTVYTEDKRTIRVHWGKLMLLKSILIASTENVLIACNYVHERERICQFLGSSAVDADKFEGNLEDAWNSGKIKWLVANPASLGHGLNLQQGGRTVVWFSIPWSRELYDQFNARVARKGQSQIPLVYRLVCTNTVEDAQIEALRLKGEGQSMMLETMTNFRKLGLTFDT